MDWTFPTQSMLRQARSGIGVVLERLEEEIGRPLRGTRFLYDGEDMVNVTREIEDALGPEDHLFVGFQRIERLRSVMPRYVRLVGQGTRVTAFAENGEDEQGLPASRALVGGMRWIETRPGRRNLENQWFLVSAPPRGVAFVGYEVSAPERIASGPASSPDRLFTGFLSDDPSVVDSLLSALRDVADAAAAPRAVSDLTAHQWRGARLVLAMTDDGSRREYERVRRAGVELAAKTGAALLLYDRSSESYLVDPYPYPEVVGWEDTLTREDVFRLQRRYLADQIDDARARGIEASAWLPRRPGPRGLAEAVERFGPDVVVAPEELAHPSLVDRIRGNSLDRFAGAAGVPVLAVTQEGIVAEPAGLGQEISV